MWTAVALCALGCGVVGGLAPAGATPLPPGPKPVANANATATNPAPANPARATPPPAEAKPPQAEVWTADVMAPRPPPSKPTPPRPTPGAIMARHGFPGDQVGFALRDLATGEWLATHQPDGAFLPASVAKVPTTLAALDLLGPTYRWETRLVATGPVVDGIVQGDVVLVGEGDPFLDNKGLAKLIARARRAGVTGVTGRFLYDDGFLAKGLEIEPSQPDNLVYNTGFGALSVDFNRAWLVWDPAKGPRFAATRDVALVPERQTVRVSTAEDPPWPHGSRRPRPAPPPDGTYDTVSLAPVGADRPAPGESWILPPNWSGRGSVWLPVRHPGAHAAYLAQTLAAEHGLVLPDPRPGLAPSGARLVARVWSPRLETVVKSTLRYSNNLTAELIGLTTTRRMTGEVLTLVDSAAFLKTVFANTLPDMDWSTFHLGNHSGLSVDSRMSPEQIVALLDYAQIHAFNGLDYAALLPRRGWRDPDTGERPKTEDDKAPVWAKTGTVYYGRGLAGYLVPQSGRLLAFAVFVSDLDRRAAFDAQNLHDSPRALGAARGWLGRAKALERDLVGLWVDTY